MTTIVKTVNKDQLQELDYLKSDVLFNNMEKNKRKILLEKAYRLGRGYETQKARIIFACKDGIKKVEARIISLNKTTITLKGVNSLPVKSVIGVDVV